MPFKDCVLLVTLALGAVAPLARAEQRSLFILFGPNAAEPARQSARAAAQTARRWLRNPEATLEIRLPGSGDGFPVSSKSSPKELEQIFVDIASKLKDSDSAEFLGALHSSAQALAHRPGTRVLAAILSSPPLSSDAEQSLGQLVEYCRDNQVRIVILDSSGGNAKLTNPALEALGRRTGGAFLSHGKTLDSTLLGLTPVVEVPAEDSQKTRAASAPNATPASLPTAGQNSATQFTLPVHTRFIRTSGRGSTGSSMNLNVGGSPGAQATGAQLAEAAGGSSNSFGPMRGLLFVEAPLNALKFEVDNNAHTFKAKARVTQIVRNLKGIVVWRAQKEVSLNGPLRKLEAKRAGNLYYLRGVTLLGGEQYTLEATIEDLLAGCSGSTRVPLKTGTTAPGLMVSDALFVRPLRADRFDADQIFAYEGLALAPILEPVFQSGEPINLQLYFLIYPDLYGDQPEVAMELLRSGKSVARMALPFTTKIHEGALEGYSVSIIGGQAHEFPYLANMKGAKLGPGEFEARISVRQSRQVLTRSVAFRVIGAGPSSAGGRGASAAAQASLDVDGNDVDENLDENADVVLPEVDPISIASPGIAMSAADQTRVWSEAAENGKGYSSRLPNFRCSQETHRLRAAIKTPDRFRETDTFKDELVYENGQENYRTVEVNGAKSSVSIREQKGIHSRGEFGSMLQALFSAEVAANYKWTGQALAGGEMCDVFEVRVDMQKSNFALYYNGRREVAGYTGRVFIDAESALVRRLTINGAGLPKDFALQTPVFSLEYGMVKVGPQDYLLPLRSVLQVRQGKFVVRNEAVFSGYRKFEASSEVQF